MTHGSKDTHHNTDKKNHDSKTKLATGGSFVPLKQAASYNPFAPLQQPAAPTNKASTLAVDIEGKSGETTTTTKTVTNENLVGDYVVGGTRTTETVTTTTGPQLKGKLHYEHKSETAPGGTTGAGQSGGGHYRAHGAAGKKAAAVDAIIVGTTTGLVAKPDIDVIIDPQTSKPVAPDARADAAALSQSVANLKETLGKYGIFKTEVALKVKGMSDASLLTTIQDDYMGRRESAITIDYTDHLGKAMDQGLAKVDITHANIEKITHAFNKATEELNKTYAQGKPVAQDEISSIVRKTIQSELQTVR